ncbi:MAG: hypothetical protein NC215_05985, partial [Ruminococcus sp.]|nr:hypothetical protein [Ruminococcus sp.]
PDGFEFKSDHFKVGDKYARVLFIRDYPSYIKDKVIWELTDCNRNMIFNFDIVPVSTEEAQKYVEKQALGVETNIANYQRKNGFVIQIVDALFLWTIIICLTVFFQFLIK